MHTPQLHTVVNTEDTVLWAFLQTYVRTYVHMHCPPGQGSAPGGSAAQLAEACASLADSRLIETISYPMFQYIRYTAIIFRK